MTDGIPGPKTRALAAMLSRFESRGVTYLAPDFPVFWDSARDARVVDVDGNAYIDLTAAFGVAAVGHSNPIVAGAIAAQAARLMHAMGDVHPPAVRPRMLEKLAEITPGDLCKSYVCSTGAEAVEAALKTALLYSGKQSIAAFRGGYHGLSLGALEVCGLERFRGPFESALTHRAVFFEYPPARDGTDGISRTVAAIRDRLHRKNDIGTMIVEPVLGRGGIILPPDGFLSALRELCDRHAVVLIFDEIYTGFGRTGTLFAAERENVVPDIMCLGKAIANGFPLSVAIAKPEIMDAWEPSQGEALHTSTYLGNPMGCAAALATIGEIERLGLAQRAHQLGLALQRRLEMLRGNEGVVDIRGRGLLWGIELRSTGAAESLVKRALQESLIVCQEGAVVSITPPLTIAPDVLDQGIGILASLLEERVTA